MIRWFDTGDARKSGCQQDRGTEAGGWIGQVKETGAIGEGVIAVVVLVWPGGFVGAPRINPCCRLRHGMSDMLDMDEAGELEEGVRGTGHPEGDQQERQDEPGASQRECSSRAAGHFKNASVLRPLSVGAARVACRLDGTATGDRRFCGTRKDTKGEGRCIPRVLAGARTRGGTGRRAGGVICWPFRCFNRQHRSLASKT